jgi:hypothetical protein
VMSTHGRGKTLLLGSYVSAAYQSTPTAEVERFYAGLLTWAGVTPPVVVSGANLEARHLLVDKDALLFVFNHGNARADGTVFLRLPQQDVAATDLVSGLAVDVVREESGVRLRVSLEPGDVRVVRIARR